jgi:Rap1a immunity proteins
MTTRVLSVLALAIALLTGTAMADDEETKTTRFESGNTLLSECTKLQAFCSGYIAGVVDVTGQVIPGWRSCIPLNVPLTQVTDIAVRYLKEHPEKRHYDAAWLVAAAMGEAFPCAPTS